MLGLWSLGIYGGKKILPILKPSAPQVALGFVLFNVLRETGGQFSQNMAQKIF